VSRAERPRDPGARAATGSAAERPRIARVVALAAAVVVLDQVVKAIALGRLTLGVPVDVVPGLVALTLVKNPGLAFGFLAGIPAGSRWLVGLLSLLALIVLFRVALRVLPRGGWREQAAIGLIFGGAVGNLIDRVRFGAVVDFVDVYFRGWHWPAFNVADSAITVGVALLALGLLTDRSPAASA
jgi:signal peptidase II